MVKKTNIFVRGYLSITNIFYHLFVKPIPRDCANKYVIRFVGLIIKSYLFVIKYTLSKCINHRILCQLDRAFFHYLAFFKPFFMPKWVKIQTVKIENVPCRLYEPQGNHRKSNACLLYMHGGAFSMMSPKHFDEHMFPFLEEIGCSILSIDYRLSPEYMFPCGFNDCWSVATKLHETDYSRFNIDPSQIILLGDSAGGNFAAGLTQKARREGKQLFAAQILIYPSVACADTSSPCFQECEQTYFDSMLLQPRMISRMMLEYVGIKAQDGSEEIFSGNKLITPEFRASNVWKVNLDHALLPEEFLKTIYYKKPHIIYSNTIESEAYCEMLKNPDFSPLLAPETAVKNLPPALVISCQYDLLRDEVILYAKKLARNGTSTTWHHYKTAFHGIFTLSGGSTRNKMFIDIFNFIKLHSVPIDLNDNILQ
uniref:Abhydrolase_3 domain-containing protein n=1 Tax=Rhabditophanes sp. KR3021 TaxID=114890 RepID=A0AC35TR68_9BILA